MVHVKKNTALIKIVCHVLIRNALHFYGLPLDLCGKPFLPKVPQFLLMFRNSAKRVFMGKAVLSLEKCCNP